MNRPSLLELVTKDLVKRDPPMFNPRARLDTGPGQVRDLRNRDDALFDAVNMAIMRRNILARIEPRERP